VVKPVEYQFFTFCDRKGIIKVKYQGIFNFIGRQSIFIDNIALILNS